MVVIVTFPALPAPFVSVIKRLRDLPEADAPMNSIASEPLIVTLPPGCEPSV
ncbi:MAG: hypothetical protein HC917_05020 [Richelia sp. SM2_1_7]|nr:hypothetical protein [Richelia sp. SM2_1_7]